MQDRNFDDIAEKFSRNIYGTTKGLLRQAILWQDLDILLAEMNDGPLRVLDAGGGEGQTAIRMAQLGHHVTLCDVSQEMLKRAQAAAEEKGISGNMHFVHCPVQDIAQHLASPVDLILFHAVLEWVADPVAVLQKLWTVLRSGGALSLMFYNADGLLMHNMVAGNFDYVQVGMPKRKKRTLSPDYPRAPAEVYRWLEQIGWHITGKTGVRVFHDYLRDKTQQQRSFEMLLELETRYCRQEPYISLGRYIHVTARKPQIDGRTNDE
ncbi:tRNA uridine 5-oxyacetic acid(34) methyltransferase CmoM [Kosakonia cowanii]|jgi:S-adenosylmethionine-dependent methyltransferase|uniref:tRNA 5-carboxymethoxyuridine methyltransferase n=1 Tax=Kosakonia cowanii JCM 10956 = DSM 18146 TaxID=1300165 RepID=A0A807LK76_9ENTR|nr:tRNA uridine 5-oxyacetic acid(34) methyltransferase CmoM [Kosakonia cowanii]APZ05985.1 S-adenosyl-L-methionine-dependent methyltransferase [Kosakonia cowanii JCM 10956 = DSM 18146]MDM9614866.1 tRNA uridine 5-oxyacetic acid(34) methyltransferase CmoM [Kosakonia cowanii]MDP4559569.1 tRNA uridine 5-oxyacetic acid(34) methyltransferase CmoM [Kosakonia cowanii]QAR46845.1 tRNA uridine 5-oxyacetic acid(34) methyltransferase CmoM [Kosakonia cowanii]